MVAEPSTLSIIPSLRFGQAVKANGEVVALTGISTANESLKDLAENISKYSVTIEANANKDGHLYGSILAADISQQLKNANYPVEPDHIKLEGPLKETGMYAVRVQLDPDVQSEVKVWVVPKAGAAT